MGGCATKSKDPDGQETLPPENSANRNPKAIEEVVAAGVEVKVEGTENENAEEEKEEPLVDLSSPKAKAPSLDSHASEEPMLAAELSELKANDASPNPSADLGETKEDKPQADTKVVLDAQETETGAAEQTEKAAAEDTAAEKSAEKVEEVADFVKDTANVAVNVGNETEEKKLVAEDGVSLPSAGKDAAAPAVSA